MYDYPGSNEDDQTPMTIEEKVAAMAVEISVLKAEVAEQKAEVAEQKLRAARIEGEQRSLIAANTKLRSDFLTMEETFTLTMQHADARLGEVSVDATDAARKVAATEANNFGQSLLTVLREVWGRK